jgi:hypothetical protein
MGCHLYAAVSTLYVEKSAYYVHERLDTIRAPMYASSMGFIDSEVQFRFWPSIDEARAGASFEAVNTGGTILEVVSIEVEVGSVIFVGRVPTECSERGTARGIGRLRVRPAGLGRLHMPWKSMLEPSGILGFLVLRPPIVLSGSVNIAEGQKVALQAKRGESSVGSCVIGSRCCVDCNGELSEQRLTANPDTRTCANCEHQRVFGAQPRSSGLERSTTRREL